MPLLRQLISCFDVLGRHRLYRNLLRSVTHAGVRGLLVHDIKNEVDLALKVGLNFILPYMYSPSSLPMCIYWEEIRD